MVRRALILIEGHPKGKSLLYVQAAKRLGLHPITLAADPAQYDYIAAERIEVIHVDTDNFDALTRECSRLGEMYSIAGITCALEKFCAITARLCRYFDLPGPNPAAIERCCDKFTQRQLLAEAGVPVPAYRLVLDGTDVKSSATQIGLPVVLKPAVGSGSRGVRLCNTLAELAEHTDYLLGGNHIWRSSPRILVEEFVQGPLYSADIMGHEVISICDGEYGPHPYFISRELTYPAVLNDDEHNRIADVSLSCMRALGLGWGPTNIELRWTKRGPIVIEVNPRMPGPPCPQLVQLAYGVDLVTEHIKLVIGDELDLRRRHSQIAAARILLPDRDGILDWIDSSRATAMPGVAEVKFYLGPKTPIVRSGDVRDCIGHVIAASPSRGQTKTILQRAVDLIDCSIIPFPAEGMSSEVRI
ncbi:acetyl-CoA carboxylase biotin carboxylase subunit family protein [Mesorhizobium sp.]|uniref:ATP-grasp domain-containing protein n=1 Tax=Mesorhizobium sp. TaxID=1871066 RepID=UPI000FE8D879|nr:acetyl-CoA carboxylase biotin carboxylase subunit family protein [Mesorhizobium sp.]RWP92431.1 MAG: ATP-grasp domain-containing protein [Mesorhizobium sp.]